ncbi:hypothetical protein OBBRIDRAFT_736787 [Obba rivulosa]|uniref:Uncharacterized protein n=1 Tax=Obba rivulosa TaxID=1052685 RepID=A0A8E2ARL6_9APHY|nr:hypothetical protein OBBRIDRAFT_736787 [Obba rivulosa]
MHVLRLWTRPGGLTFGYTARVVAKVILASWPLAVPYIVCFYATGVHKRVARIRVGICVIWRTCREWIRPSYFKYRDLNAEGKYWERSARDQKALQASNASTIPPEVPLVKYYMPKLLPPYRSLDREDLEAKEYYLSARIYCKWHRMVFQGPHHPTLRQAEELVRWHSNRDRREMYRISRMLTDEEVFGQSVPWDPRYRYIWRKWLETKGGDIAIVFV